MGFSTFGSLRHLISPQLQEKT